VLNKHPVLDLLQLRVCLEFFFMIFYGGFRDGLAHAGEGVQRAAWPRQRREDDRKTHKGTPKSISRHFYVLSGLSLVAQAAMRLVPRPGKSL